MSVNIKRVSYCFNSALEGLGQNPYFLDVLVSRDKETLVDCHESFKSREELFAAMEAVIPILETIEEPVAISTYRYDPDEGLQ